MTTHKINLVQAADDYSHRWVQPRMTKAGPDGGAVSGFDAEVQLSGSFKHNRHHPFEVVVFDDEQGFAAWHGGRVPAGAVGGLSAQSVAITAWKEAKPERIAVQAGDILETPIGNYEIRDDWGLHDPYLVRVLPDFPPDVKVIREERVGDTEITLSVLSWRGEAGGRAGGLYGNRYELAVADFAEEGGRNRWTVVGQWVEGSEAISQWQRFVAVEQARRA